MKSRASWIVTASLLCSVAAVNCGGRTSTTDQAEEGELAGGEGLDDPGVDGAGDAESSEADESLQDSNPETGMPGALPPSNAASAGTPVNVVPAAGPNPTPAGTGASTAGPPVMGMPILVEQRPVVEQNGAAADAGTFTVEAPSPEEEEEEEDESEAEESSNPVVDDEVVDDEVVDDEVVDDPLQECVPMTCELLGMDCGIVDDGCGNDDLDCGPCASTTCPGGTLTAVTLGATGARGMSFTGDDNDYSSLYYVPCETVTDCEIACAEVGGNEAMCAASECTSNGDGTNDCLPATIWLGDTRGVEENGNYTDIAAEFEGYNDPLAVEGFGFAVPADAQIEGIQVEFLRNVGSGELVIDHEIRVLSGGEHVGEVRAYPEDIWGVEFEWISYGGADDLWGVAWTPAAINAADFGASISVAYLGTAGHSRAHVDHARITVYFATGCDELATR
jgi:hypothetical protein